MAENLNDSPDTIAGFKAERQTSLRFDFDLEDIIAGNTPDSEIGRQLSAIVDNSQGLPTQGKIEAALMPLYEASMADFYRAEGGTAQPPNANRQNVKEHAVKVLQARKVKKTALLRAARGGKPTPKQTSPVTRFQLIGIACLVVLVAVVFYVRS
jgi:hypothetical protein